MGGGGKTTTNTITQQAPQIVPQGVPGYLQAQQYYGGLLTDPTQAVYQGQRVAPLAPGQTSAIGQAQSLFGGGPTSTNQAVENYLNTTLGGGYLAGPQAQTAVAGLAAPLFQQFEQEVLPGIRDRAQFSGQGLASSRRDVATGEAIQRLGQGLATGAVAPIYQTGVGAMEQAAQTAPSLSATEIGQLGALSQAGGTQQQQAQAQINALMQRFTDPFNVSNQAANALFGAATPGGAGGTSSSVGANQPGALGTVGALSGLATSAIASYALISALGAGKTGGEIAAAAAPAALALV